MNLLIFLGGMAFLTLGAELLVRGAARLAIILGVPPIVVGLTIVAYGTSTPELVVSAQAAVEGRDDLAVGNVVGSNIFNTLIILGISAAISPIVCNVAFVKREIPIMIAVTVLVYVLAFAGIFTHGAREGGGLLYLEQWTGILMLALLVTYSYTTYIRGRRTQEALSEDVQAIVEEEKKPHGLGHTLLQIFYVVAGLALLVYGATLVVNSATEIARVLGVPELVISLTLVAAGTSLPELATSLVAAIRKHSDISIGNVVGSNIFNILGVLGVSATLRPLSLNADVVYRDLPVALVCAVLCVPVMMGGRIMSRREGIFFLLLYVAYSIVLGVMTVSAGG